MTPSQTQRLEEIRRYWATKEIGPAKSDITRLLSLIDELEARVNETHKCNLIPFGTDGCSECDTGRITLFYNGSLKCLSCEQKPNPKEPRG